jgi:hypothetical protein
MLQDPENIEDISIVVYADSEEQARAIAEKRARLLADADKNTIIGCIGCKRITETTGRYVCTLRLEVS